MGVTNMCATTLTQAAHGSQQLVRLARFEADVRRCLAYKAYALCIRTTRERLAASPEKQASMPAATGMLASLWLHASELVERYCVGGVSDPVANDAYQKVVTQWLSMLKRQRQSPN